MTLQDLVVRDGDVDWARIALLLAWHVSKSGPITLSAEEANECLRAAAPNLPAVEIEGYQDRLVLRIVVPDAVPALIRG